MKQYLSDFLGLLFGPKDYSWGEIVFALAVIAFIVGMIILYQNP